MRHDRAVDAVPRTGYQQREVNAEGSLVGFRGIDLALDAGVAVEAVGAVHHGPVRRGLLDEAQLLDLLDRLVVDDSHTLRCEREGPARRLGGGLAALLDD